jgi:two-component system nitrogen regulation response regulator GlnG
MRELESLSAERGAIPFEIANDAIALLRDQVWPGNVRELRLTVRRMAILAGERRLLDREDVRVALELNDSIREGLGSPASPADGWMPRSSAATSASRADFDQRERDELRRLLGELRWNVAAAARRLGISRGSLRSRMRRLGLDSRATTSQ